MKHKQLILAAVAFFGCILTATAQLAIPSDGSDGALNITEDTVIDLSQAVTGTWDQNNTANVGKGVYDPEKWAVVFKYSSVNIEGHTTGSPAQLVGRKVTFKNHPSKAPVVWLVQGNVTVNGILDLRGEGGTSLSPERLTPSSGGPGAFRGAATGPEGSGSGYGPGGGPPNNEHGVYRGIYGNPQAIPLIGGSGGRADYRSGAGGGGAILIASSGQISILGSIDVRGGSVRYNEGTYQGSPGAVRLIASNVSGTGTIEASQETGARGIVRIETQELSTTLKVYPETIGVPPANPPILWPAANAPKARVVSVDSVNAPLEPTAPLIAAADVAIQNNAPVNILIETRDFPIEGVVQLSVIPKFSQRSSHTATRISGDINVATWRVTTTLPQGFVTLQARATQP